MKRRFLANRQEMVGTRFGKENKLRKSMLLLGLLAAMMLVDSPVLAWQPGPNEGKKYSKNYYPGRVTSTPLPRTSVNEPDERTCPWRSEDHKEA
jgi:hypothetical protein